MSRISAPLLAVSTLLPWIALVTALGAWGTKPADLVILFMTGLTFFVGGCVLWVAEVVRSP